MVIIVLKIEVINNQNIDGQIDIVEEKADVKVNTLNGKIYLMYKTETDSVMIIVAKDSVTVKRSGSVNSTMVFERGKKTKTIYNMPYGKWLMEIETEKIVNAMTETGGRLRLVYAMTIQGQRIFNDMRITVK